MHSPSPACLSRGRIQKTPPNLAKVVPLTEDAETVCEVRALQCQYAVAAGVKGAAPLAGILKGQRPLRKKHLLSKKQIKGSVKTDPYNRIYPIKMRYIHLDPHHFHIRFSFGFRNVDDVLYYFRDPDLLLLRLLNRSLPLVIWFVRLVH